MQIVVLGYIVRGPLGGMCWHHLQYVLGLKQMGHDVLFLEDSEDYPACYNPDSFEMTTDPSYGLAFIRNLFNYFGLQKNWAYFDANTNNWFGLQKEKVLSFTRSADLVLNISGINPARDWWINIPARILIDTDPGFTQIKHLCDQEALKLAQLHNSFFSFGENVGNKNCLVPADGFKWQATRQPLFMKAWKQEISPGNKGWTTVMQWDSYKDRKYNHLTFGMKSLSFQEYKELPEHLPGETFEIALGGTTAPVKELGNYGWSIISSQIPTKTPWSYQEFIKTSKGEWSVAKHGYVASRSGWFSERSAAYLASGKPVIVQDTGFSDFLPATKGILAFSTLEEAIEKVKAAGSDYKNHCLKAREIADQYFGHEKVLKCLLDKI